MGDKRYDVDIYMFIVCYEHVVLGKAWEQMIPV